MTGSYYNWLVEQIDGDCGSNHQKLLRCLFETEFIPYFPMDANRADDGVRLRNTYEYENGRRVNSLPFEECSMLEMMIALARQLEFKYLGHVSEDDNTGEWFWEMIESMGLYVEDRYFSEGIFDHIIEVFLDNEYNFDGDGGLFRVINPFESLANVDIWTQMNWYVTEKLNE